MATGALGSVSNRLRHENGDTHVVICDDVFSDAGSTPAASTNQKPELCSGFFIGVGGEVLSRKPDLRSVLAGPTPAAELCAARTPM